MVPVRFRAGYSAVTLLLAAASCGIPLQGSPQKVPDRQVPFGLAGGTTSTTSAQHPGQAIQEIFLVSSTMHLLIAKRVVAAPVDASSVLATLLAGPSNAEAFSGITSDIPAGTSIRSVHVSANTATVDLTDDFATATGQSQILAIAQIVYTVTQVPGILQVSFELGGVATEVPSSDGTLLTRPVTRSDYSSLAPGISDQATG